MIIDVNFLEAFAEDILNIKSNHNPMEYFLEDILYESIVPNIYTMKNKEGRLLLVYNQENGYVVNNVFFNLILVNFISKKNLQDLKKNLVPINNLLFSEEKVFVVLEAYNMKLAQKTESFYYRTHKKNLVKEAYPAEGTLLHATTDNLCY